MPTFPRENIAPLQMDLRKALATVLLDARVSFILATELADRVAVADREAVTNHLNCALSHLNHLVFEMNVCQIDPKVLHHAPDMRHQEVVAMSHMGLYRLDVLVALLNSHPVAHWWGKRRLRKMVNAAACLVSILSQKRRR